jgi:hypothetical protein
MLGIEVCLVAGVVSSWYQIPVLRRVLLDMFRWWGLSYLGECLLPCGRIDMGVHFRMGHRMCICCP